MRNRVLFGETAAISSPLDTLFAALCLNEEGRPFRGARRQRQGCSRPHKLPIGGVAIHPYNNHASGTIFTRSYSRESHAPAYVPRVHRLIDRAARLGRIPRGRKVFITEFGFQSNPPDATYGLGLRRHATALNEADRLYFADREWRRYRSSSSMTCPRPCASERRTTSTPPASPSATERISPRGMRSGCRS